MRDLPGNIALWLGGLGFIGFGIAFLIAPLDTLALAGVEARGAGAAVELRAFYGGLELALGALLVTAALRPRHREAGLWLCLAAYAGLGLARAAGMLAEGFASPFHWVALGLELGLALLAGGALRRGQKS